METGEDAAVTKHLVPVRPCSVLGGSIDIKAGEALQLF